MIDGKGRRLRHCVPWVLVLAIAAAFVGRELVWRSRFSKLAEIDRLLRPVVLARDAATEKEAIEVLGQYLRSRGIGWGMAAYDCTTGQAFQDEWNKLGKSLILELKCDLDWDCTPERVSYLTLKDMSNVRPLLME